MVVKQTISHKSQAEVAKVEITNLISESVSSDNDGLDPSYSFRRGQGSERRLESHNTEYEKKP